jgi:hypothetical protein
LVYFSRFALLYREKSGNLAQVPEQLEQQQPEVRVRDVGLLIGGERGQEVGRVVDVLQGQEEAEGIGECKMCHRFQIALPTGILKIGLHEFSWGCNKKK